MGDNPHGLDDFEISHRDDSNLNADSYGPECLVTAEHNGFQLRMPAAPHEVDYVRVCDPDGNEIAYWSIDEVKADPADVLGAFMGALVRGA